MGTNGIVKTANYEQMRTLLRSVHAQLCSVYRHTDPDAINPPRIEAWTIGSRILLMQVFEKDDSIFLYPQETDPTWSGTEKLLKLMASDGVSLRRSQTSEVYAVIKSADGEGVVVSHTRTNQADANKLAVEIVMEAIDGWSKSESELEQIRRDTTQTLEEHGVVLHDNFSVTVIQSSTNAVV